MTAVMKMEWLKLRSVRSTWWIMAAFVAGLIGLAMLLLGTKHWAQLSPADRASWDPTEQGFVGLALGQLLLGALGVLVMTAEYSSGSIRSTLAAVPRRPRVLAAKAAVLGGTALVIGELFSFAAFFAGQAMLKAPAPHASLGQAGVLRAVLMGGAYPALVGLIGLGLGAVIRHTAGAICAVVGLIMVVPLLVIPMGASAEHAVERFLPEQMAENSLTAVKPVAHSLPPAASLGLLCAYAAAALAAGAWALARRDA